MVDLLRAAAGQFVTAPALAVPMMGLEVTQRIWHRQKGGDITGACPLEIVDESGRSE